MSSINQHEWVIFFLQISFMLSMALAGGIVMRRLHQPAVMGELIGGIILGPTIFGLLAPEAYVWLFPTPSIINPAREAVITLGMLFFLFSAGLEINLARLSEYSRVILLISFFGIIIPFGLGFGAVLLWPELWMPSIRGYLLPVFIGTALSISALPVIVRILMDLDLLETQMGNIIVTSAVIDDIIGWSLFALSISAFIPENSSQSPLNTISLVAGFLILFWVIGRWVMQPLLRWVLRVVHWTGGFISVIAIMILAAAALAEKVGIHPAFGAFQVGVSLGQGLDLKKHNPVYEIIHQFALNFFAPLYFVSVGLKANFLKEFDPVLVLVVILIACIGKVLGAGFGARLGGLGLKKAFAIGSGLNARGAMEIILASVALEYRIIDQRIFVALVVMALVTSMLAGPLMKIMIRKPA